MRIGSLFSGYGGLDQWVSDIDKGANKVLAHRYPDAPNIGDISTVDWTTVEPVQILTGGFPCQDVSHAGKRAGVRPGTRSGLWTQMGYAIDQLKPELVVIENVRGLLSASAHSDMEQCSWCVGEGTDRGLRALGAVLGDLADVGYDARWCGLRAADVGAPHGRFRVFIVAYPTNGGGRWERDPNVRGFPIFDTHGAEPVTGKLIATPQARDWKGNGFEGQNLPNIVGELLPTPTRQDGTSSGPSQIGRNTPPLSSIDQLLPTPVAMEAQKASQIMSAERRAESGQVFLSNVVVSHFGEDHTETQKIEAHGTWGPYAAAVARWEKVNGPAPSPVEIAPKGHRRLSAKFDEWMMGLPAGWVTDVPGITWNESLKLCGNGVVPAQAFAALTRLLG
jgi:DNA (cytosine-5)-methyltransferase 1